MDTASIAYRNSFFAFLALSVLVIVGFWRTYFSQPFDVAFHAHFHGIAMSLWCILLISQAYLMRVGRRDIHRQLGRMSYFLVPVIVVATLSFANARIRQEGLTPARFYILYIQLHLLLLFVIAYCFAIYYRRRPVLHMRFMICTALPLIDPALARIIETYIWQPANPVHIQMITYAATDLVLVGLIATNWKRELRLGVYPAMLVMFVLLHVPNFVLDRIPVWISFTKWFRSLPLS